MNPLEQFGNYCPTPDKRAYDTKMGAIQSAWAIWREKGRELVPYDCSCGKFHLTTHRNQSVPWPPAEMRIVF
jgi:hypothetical protein